jgi:predicted transcriptional regulator of viral defense system
MEFSRLLELVGNEPAFETSLLLAGDVDPAVVRLQLSRWKASGRIYQLRRGLYSLAPPYQKISPHPFVIANHLVRASYVSCQSALAQYGLIPDVVPVTVSVTTSRPSRRQTPLGDYEFHHIKQGLLLGYQMTDLGGGQQAFVAAPEKALLDLVYLQPGGDSPAFLRELRLQNLERVDLEELYRLAKRVGMPKLERVADRVTELARIEGEEYETL